LYVDPLEEELLTEDATDEIDGEFLSLAGVARGLDFGRVW
jgi:hypothetical protein